MTEFSVKINVGKGYEVRIGSSLLDDCGNIIAKTTSLCRVAVITDSNVEKLYLDKVIKSLQQAGFDTLSFSFPAGEESKNISTLSDILEFLAENNFSRTDMLIALGGGVTGDITGFAAAVYLRGIRYVQLPTTLLAAVDSSVGGKTAIDLKAGKNLAGAFKQPEIVLCDISTFETLPETEFSNGIAESIKYGILFDKPLFDAFASSDLSSNRLTGDKLTDVIAKCVAHKGRIVELDEFDNGDRRLLNLGHTIGHAIEKCSSFKIQHGHAVEGTANEISQALAKYALPIDTDFDIDELNAVTLTDKKRAGKKIALIVPEETGKCIIKTEPVEALREYITLGKGV